MLRREGEDNATIQGLFRQGWSSPDDAIVTALIEARNSNSHPAEKKTCDKGWFEAPG
jgi:hypothetical protein